MRILFLTNNLEVAQPLIDWLSERENVYVADPPRDWDGRINNRDGEPYAADCVISYCYKHILSGDVIRHYGGRCINLHNSFLPYGRGVQPLFYAIRDNEPVGVSIHWMTEEVDGGKVIAQTPIHVGDGNTFREAYEYQHKVMRDVFKDTWPWLRGEIGSYHSMADFNRDKHILTKGWDTPIEEVRDCDFR